MDRELVVGSASAPVTPLDLVAIDATLRLDPANAVIKVPRGDVAQAVQEAEMIQALLNAKFSRRGEDFFAQAFGKDVKVHLERGRAR